MYKKEDEFHNKFVKGRSKSLVLLNSLLFCIFNFFSPTLKYKNASYCFRGSLQWDSPNPDSPQPNCLAHPSQSPIHGHNSTV